MNKAILSLILGGLFTHQTALAACNSNDADFVKSSQGWVLQKSTGLIWQPCLHGMDYDDGSCAGDASELPWQNALETAETNTAFGSADWRLPNVKELASLLEFSCDTRVNEAAFADQPSDSTLWSSTAAAPVPNGDNSMGAMTVRFYSDALQPNQPPRYTFSYVHFVNAQNPSTPTNLRLVRNTTPEDLFSLQTP
ncbi:MAG: DUF1566 domain-containing protein [Saccharospirillum sp.]|nr:DUF1566 domain-containing protein [Saccharospirillum sp.]